MPKYKIKLNGIRHHDDDTPELRLSGNRVYICGINEGGYNSTAIDLMDVLKYLNNIGVFFLYYDAEDTIKRLFNEDWENEE